jgi:hypothetical protein
MSVITNLIGGNVMQAHEWTNGSDKVLLIKCVDKGGKSKNDFQWPRSGKTICPMAKADRKTAETPKCDTGGLFGWPWGLSLGEGKEPDYNGDWLVFSADKADVISVEGKAKAIGEVEVVYYGDALGAIMFTHKGRMAFINENASAATSGDSSSAATSGDSSSAATSGDSSSAATSGDSSSAATSGDSSSAATSGYSSSAATSGDRSSAATSGYSSSAATSGDSSSAATSGDSSSAATSGYSSSAATSGYSSSAATSGYRSSAATSGDSSSAKATGKASIACACGEYIEITVGPESFGTTTANRWLWHVLKGAVVACRWLDGDKWQQKLLIADDLSLADGASVYVQNGEIVKQWS